MQYYNDKYILNSQLGTNFRFFNLSNLKKGRLTSYKKKQELRKLPYKVTWKIKFKCQICLSCLSRFDLDVLVFLSVLKPMMTMETILTMTTMHLSSIPH